MKGEITDLQIADEIPLGVFHKVLDVMSSIDVKQNQLTTVIRQVLVELIRQGTDLDRRVDQRLKADNWR